MIPYQFLLGSALFLQLIIHAATAEVKQNDAFARGPIILREPAGEESTNGHTNQPHSRKLRTRRHRAHVGCAPGNIDCYTAVKTTTITNGIDCSNPFMKRRYHHCREDQGASPTAKPSPKPSPSPFGMPSDSNPSFWSQIGADVNGEGKHGWSGYSVALSSDGTRIAIGAPYNDGNGERSGHVRVYEFDGSSWVQLGADIDGEFENDEFGTSVAMSSDGTMIAIGAKFNDSNGLWSGHARVYEYGGSGWVQLGADIDGEGERDYSGSSVAMSSAGTRIAIGAMGNGDNGSMSGHVRVYDYDGSGWVQLGPDIDGEAANDLSGNSVAMSSDGTRIAIGATHNDGIGNACSGHVRIYEHDGSIGTWEQLGADIDGEALSDTSGNSVAMSSDGARIAIGAPRNDGNGENSGQVRVFEYDGSGWVQLGADIDGEAEWDQFGTSVAMSSDGSRIAIGAPENDGNGAHSGHVRVFEYNAKGEWEQLCADIDGEAYDKSGYSIAMSSDGTRIAIGAPENGGIGGDHSGNVRVFNIDDTCD